MRHDNEILKHYGQAMVEKCRVREPRRTPEWVRHCTDRLGDLLVERHLCRSEEAWGLAKNFPNQELAYDECGSLVFMMYAQEFRLFEKVGGWNEAMRQRTIRFWQAWQNPQTGRFQDPWNPARNVNAKYVVELLQCLDAVPLYPWTNMSGSGEIDSKVFRQQARDDRDWNEGGWGVGSRTGSMAVEICHAIAKGREDLIPDLEQGLQDILSHQDPTSGLWGPPTAPLEGRIGGALKVLGRIYFRLGMLERHTRALTDSLIRRQCNGDFYGCSADICIERNVCEVAAYGLEASAYRREELHEVLERAAEIIREHINPDGSVSWYRGDRNGGGGNALIITYPLGICGAYLHWQDCPFPSPILASERGLAFPWRPALLSDGKVKMVRQASPCSQAAT